MKNHAMQTIVILFFSLVSSLYAVGSEPLRISKIKLDRKKFAPSKKEVVNISFETNQSAQIQVIIYDRLGQEIKTITVPSTKAGQHRVQWDGYIKKDKRPFGNLFLYVIKSKSENGKEVVYNPATKTGGNLIKVHNYTYDKKTGKIKYVLPKACMVRFRAGLKESMLAKTIMDWRPQKAGRHTFQWDGKDSTGLLDLSRHPELELKLTCYTLPDNTIIVTNPPVDMNNSYPSESADVWNISDKKKYIHHRHDPRICHEPKFTVSFPKSQANKDGVHVLSGNTPVRVEIDKRDKMDLINKRFEIMLYIDGTFLFEMEEGTSPFTFNWNTKGFIKGPHILTVNIMSYDDHIGVKSQKILIGE